MFKDIRILVAESDRTIERTLNDCLTALSFTVLTASTVSACMDAITDDHPDILILDEELVNGTSLIILDYWISRQQGPIMVFVEKDVNEQTGHNHPLLGKGVWNVLTLDKEAENISDVADIQALNTTILRYAQIVEVWRGFRIQKDEIEGLKKMQRALWASTITLALSLVAYAGPEVLPRVIALVFGGG